MTIKTGIEVTGKLVAGNIISGARAAKSAVESIGTGAARAKAATVSAMKAIGGSMTALNQGLEVGKKAAAALSAAFAITAGKALELRAANDPAKKSLEDAGKAADRLGVAIGDVLVPMLAAAASALTPVVEGAARWLDLNRTMIASQFVPWLGDVGKTLVSGVATGFVLAAKAAYGLKMATGAVEDAANQAQAAVARDAVARLDIAIRDQGLRSWEREAMIGRLEEQERLVKKYDDAAEASARGVGQAIADLAALEAKTADTALSIQRGIGDAAADVFDRLSQRIVKASTAHGKLYGDMTAHVAEFRAIEAGAAAADAAAFDAKIARQRQEATVTVAFNKQVADLRAAKRKEATEKEQVESLAALTATRDKVRGVSDSIATAGVSGVMGVLRGAENAGDALLGFFESVGESILSTIAESAAAAAASGIFNILTGGIGGTLLGGLGSIFGLAKGGMIGPMPMIPAATGGLVIGGSSGIDSVPIMSMPGEYITPAAEVRANLRAGREPGDGGSRGGGTSITVSAGSSTFMPESSADFDRRLNNALLPAIRRLTRAGVRLT